MPELKRLYFTYGKTPIEIENANDTQHVKKPNFGHKSRIYLKYKLESECNPNNFNLLDDELIFLGRIEGSRQAHINIKLNRDIPK